MAIQYVSRFTTSDKIHIAIRMKLFLKQVSHSNIFLYSSKFINPIGRSIS